MPFLVRYCKGTFNNGCVIEQNQVTRVIADHVVHEARSSRFPWWPAYSILNNGKNLDRYPSVIPSRRTSSWSCPPFSLSYNRLYSESNMLKVRKMKLFDELLHETEDRLSPRMHAKLVTADWIRHSTVPTSRCAICATLGISSVLSCVLLDVGFKNPKPTFHNSFASLSFFPATERCAWLTLSIR